MNFHFIPRETSEIIDRTNGMNRFFVIEFNRFLVMCIWGLAEKERERVI